MVATGLKCTAFNCQELAKVKGFCAKHYKRVQRHGEVKARVNSGGSTKIPVATKHPLYNVWRSCSRTEKGQSICERWKVFENFVVDVVAKPEGKLWFRRKDPGGIFEPSNVYWATFDNTEEFRKRRSGYVKTWMKVNPDYARNASLKKMYGVTAEWYDGQYEKQSGLCAICGQPESQTSGGKTQKLAVDHCHETGKVRGLLCSDCNRGIGFLKHSPDLLRASVKYLGA